MDLHNLARGAKIKGLGLLGTGDFTHPRWLQELKESMKGGEEGIFSFGGVEWILQTELSLIYSQDKKVRRIHHCILAPSFEVVDQINAWLDKKGRRDYDGRPIFGFSSPELVENLMGISKDILIFPAHAWTPHFAIFGSKSGFDSVEECFQDQARHIFALETGLSSDPAMNRRISKLDSFTLLSNSDPHSPHPWRLGREANAFDMKELTYKNLIGAIKTRNGLAHTVEVPPTYGKYHWDGHRDCGVVQSPKETLKKGDKCRACGKPLTIGVEYRVEQLADRPEGFVPKDAVPFKSLIPLVELLATAMGYGVSSQKVMDAYNLLTTAFGTEFAVLLEVPFEKLANAVPENVAAAIIRNRQGRIRVQPGYDGVYGKIILEEKESSLAEFA
jgi:uncharacterized protein (TIGR00375 family)